NRSVLTERWALQVKRKSGGCDQQEQGSDEEDSHWPRITLAPAGTCLSVALLSEVGRGLVCQHALDLADPGDRGGDPAARFPAEARPGPGFDELAAPEPACIAGRPAGRQNVVRADRLVRVGDGRLLAEEERAVVAEPAEVPVEVSGLDFEVL